MMTPTLLLIIALGLNCLGLTRSQAAIITETTRSLPLPVLTGFQGIANQKVPAGTVSGRVTLRGKGVPRINVALRISRFEQRRPALVGTTDPEGNYRINNVPAGEYRAAPVAPAFVVTEPNRLGGSEGKLVILKEGEDVTGIDFTLVKAGVITGKVVDAEGRPVVEERLNLIAVDPNDKNVWPQLLNFRTDDRGVYRIFGVPAGRYKVAVGEDRQMGAAGIGRPRRPYKQTYHSNPDDPSQPAVVEVLEGGELSGIDITVGSIVEGYSASGRVVDGETGKPSANIRLGAVPRTDNRGYGYQPVGSRSSNSGEFKIEGLTPGSYSLVVPQYEDDAPLAEPIHFEVVDRDVLDLIIKTSKGATLTGVVVLDGSNDKTLLARLYQLRLNLMVQRETPGLSTWRSTAINPDGSFRVTGLPTGVVTVSTLSSLNYQPASDFVVLHTEREGTRLTQGIEIKAVEETSGLRVVVAHGKGVVRGELIFVNGTTPPGTRLMVQLTRAGESTPLRAAEVDARWHFAIEGMPAGTYWLQIQGYIPGARNQFPREEVNVVDGVATEVRITIDLNPIPGSSP